MIYTPGDHQIQTKRHSCGGCGESTHCPARMWLPNKNEHTLQCLDGFNNVLIKLKDFVEFLLNVANLMTLEIKDLLIQN